ncbi:globin domain-containing protein [Kitasatospora sp. NPDC002040]|uniref:globin domain-containing protein n=1 Tax=Kitasatospora sp. NPDC002040 TaxID=3154661 RepID=UPI00331BA1D7
MSFDPALIRASFAVVERRADQLAKYFYVHLFAHSPELRRLFPAELTEQRDRLFHALTELVLRLEQPGELTEYLRALGRDHRKFRTTAEHYPAVGSSLIAALRHFSGHSWTQEIEKAWTEAYTVISQTMIAAAEADTVAPVWWEAEVTDRRRAAPDLVVLTLRPDQPYPYVAGQYLSLSSPRLPRLWRSYTIAGAPRGDGTLELHVRRVFGGRLSSALVNDVLPGEKLLLGPPIGDTVLDPRSDRPLLAVAGGTGWATVKALIEQLARGRARSATVFLAARQDADQYDLPAVRALVAEHAWLEVVLAAPEDGAEREAAVDLLRTGLRHGSDWSGHDIYLSGPPDLAPELAELLVELHAEPGLIRYDPAPLTARSGRPLSSSEWFLTPRAAPWARQ